MSAKAINPPDPCLRMKAEEQRAILHEVAVRSPAELLHELQVHQIELEMQNQALREATLALEASRDRYADLYEFSPVSFLTLTHTGQIAEINLTGTKLLGEPRRKLLQRRLASYVVPEDQDMWHKHFMNQFKPDGEKTCELRLCRKDGTVFDGCLDCLLIKADGAQPELRLALTDITERKQREAARRLVETRLAKLTQREREVLALALSGMTNAAIASKLRISLRTVDGHRARIYLKSGFGSLVELALHAASAGVLLTNAVA